MSSAAGPQRARRPIRSVSVLVPTFQGAAFLERQLDALAAQRLALPWDLAVVDSGSTDGTLEILERRLPELGVPARLEVIHPVEFDHGDTRNHLAARSAGDLLVYLTQDAIPIGPDWLAQLVENFADEGVAAVTCRNVPRPDADPLTVASCRLDPGYAAGRREVRQPDPATWRTLDVHQRRELLTFNDVASAIRREVWELHPFPRTDFGEDLLMARALLAAGWTVVYDDAAAVEHSHDYDADETRARARLDGRFSAEWLDRISIASLEDAGVQVERQLEQDRAALVAAGVGGAELERQLERARGLRRAYFEGLWEAGRTQRRRPPTRVLERADLSVLYVVHGFPPESWAGTEVYALNLARAVAARGHRVTVLARSAAEPGSGEPGCDEPDGAVVESELGDLRVLRLVHRLEHPTLRQSFRVPLVEEAFRGVLERERPDLVHFQHLIHLSAGLVDVARERGLPTVLHLHDYWALCPRVQLVRPDGQRCPTGMGHGCLWCIKDKRYSRVPALKRAGPWLAPVVRAAARVVHGRRAERSRRTGLQRALADWTDLEERHAVVRAAYAAADRTISPSRFLRQLLVETADFDPHTTLFSDNGMRTDHLAGRTAKRPDAQGRLRVGFVGSLVWYKGTDVLVRAMRLLADRPIVARIHGPFRPDEDAHHAELRDLARGAPVEFLGRFDNARLAEVHAGIDVLAVPSVWYENSPVTIHEAWLSRTPLVVSDLGGMAELVGEGRDGLRFAPGDPEALAAVLRRLLDEPELLGRLAAAAPAVKTIADDAADYEYRYRALVAGRPAPR